MLSCPGPALVPTCFAGSPPEFCFDTERQKLVGLFAVHRSAISIRPTGEQSILRSLAGVCSPQMALTATIYHFAILLSDIDRGVYEKLDMRVAQQPSETLENMFTRVLAYCLEYQEGIEFTEGVAAGDWPAVLVRDPTDRITAWIEVGSPDADRLHRGSKLAGRAAVYTYRSVSQLMAQLCGRKIHRAGDIPVYGFGRGFIERVVGAIQRRTEVTVSITERQMYLDLNGQGFTATIEEHRIN
jgi:uncharacterized protein YaeQ